MTDRTGSAHFVIRGMTTGDVTAVTSLLDEAIGVGFWDLGTDLADIALVATDAGRIVGIGTACIDAATPSTATLPTPIGAVRLVAVAPQARRKGIATRLVGELVSACTSRGAASLLAYAWVHVPIGIAPLSGALAASRLTFHHRIEHFYAGAAGVCPVCEQSPCICPADVYTRILDTTEGTA